jgi:quinol monooxygenase YgiN
VDLLRVEVLGRRERLGPSRVAAVHRLLIAEIHGLAGREDELVRLLADLAAAARTEDGCELFRALRGDEAGEFVLLSAWRDEAALRAHYAGTPYRRYRAAVGELLARPSDVTVHHVAETVHAIDPNPPEPGLFG